MVSRVITATMLFVQFILYSSSFVGTLKTKIPGAALELCQLILKQFSPDILKFSTKHEHNPFTLNCFMVPRTCLFKIRSKKFQCLLIDLRVLIGPYPNLPLIACAADVLN